MDILEKITTMRMERHWTALNTLSLHDALPIYRKNMLPSIPSLEKICDAFGITLSQFFLEDTNKTVLLNDNQIKLLYAASKLDNEQLGALMKFLNTL